MKEERGKIDYIFEGRGGSAFLRYTSEDTG